MTGGHAPDTRAGAYRPDPDEEKCICEDYYPDCAHRFVTVWNGWNGCLCCGADRNCPIHGGHEDTREPIRDKEDA